MKITCLILAYNEQERIRIALTHAIKWADEVVVVDKGSTDSTCSIAEHMGATVKQIPFSRQGHENIEQMAACASNDWVWGFTPGEVPTTGLIDAGRGMVSDNYDMIRVPMYYYSFGLHHEASPWAGGYQPRLYNRQRVTFTGVAHDPIRAKHIGRIDRTPDRFVLHQTHATAQDFMRSHSDYMVNEAAQGEPKETMGRALAMSAAFDNQFQGNPELFPHMLAWKTYWLGVALHAWEAANPGIAGAYKARAEAALCPWRS